MATPMIVGGKKMGNLFMGQFFFDNEQVDREVFRRQAQKYGFDEKEYLAALDKVPRLSRENVDKGKQFFMNLAAVLSQSSYTNIKLAQSLARGEKLTKSLQENERKLAAVFNGVAETIMMMDTEGKILLQMRLRRNDGVCRPPGSLSERTALALRRPNCIKNEGRRFRK